MIFDLLKKYKSVVSYLIFGGLTTLVNIASYYVFFNLLKFSNVPATIIAWFLAVIFAFLTNKIWVFESKSFENKIILYEFITFFLCRISTGFIDVLIMWIAVDRYLLNAIVWKVISNMIVIILNYIASKLIIFKRAQNNE